MLIVKERKREQIKGITMRKFMPVPNMLVNCQIL
jgi:hypothetical protein